MLEIRPILLVEDSADDVELMVAALRAHGFANPIEVARDGERALEYLQRRGRFANRPPGLPGVVLLDLKLPKVSGLEVLAAMRADDALKRVPVVILTSSREDGDLVRGYELGTNAYVVKPVNFADFTAAVRQIGLFWAVLNELPREVATS